MFTETANQGREQKKIEMKKENVYGKLLRRKVMRRKRPLPTEDSRISSMRGRPINTTPSAISMKRPTSFEVLDQEDEDEEDEEGEDVGIRRTQKLRRKKIPVVLSGASSSKVVTFKPSTDALRTMYANETLDDDQSALNRTMDEKRCKLQSILYFVICRTILTK